MIRINLLPHREIRRKQQQQQFFILLGSIAMLGVAIWLGVSFLYLAGELKEQQGRNKILEQAIVKVDKEIEDIKKLKEQIAALLDAAEEQAALAKRVKRAV